MNYSFPRLAHSPCPIFLAVSIAFTAAACASAQQAPTPVTTTTAAPHPAVVDSGSLPAAIPGIPNLPDVVTVVPFYEKPHQTDEERLQVVIPAEVDGHRGNFLVDLGNPDLDLNRTYLQPSPNGGVDTITNANRIPEETRDDDDPNTWDKVRVTMRIGTFRVDVDDPDINKAPNQHQFNAMLNHIRGNYDFLAPLLGHIGLCVLEQFETIIDFPHRRLILIRLDTAGHRLAAVPAYTSQWSAPLIDVSRDAAYYGVQQWWGIAVRPDNTLDIRTPANNTVTRQMSTLPWGWVKYPQPYTWGDLGYPFLRQLGVVGFNHRTHQFILYR